MKGETKKYAWIVRLRHGSSIAAAQALGVAKQTFSTWLNGPREALHDNFMTLKKHAEAIPLVELYLLVTARLKPQKSRQGQRSDLKNSLQPARIVGSEAKDIEGEFFSQLRPELDEVVYFVGRLDVLIAKILNLGSKHDVHFIQKVLDAGNLALISALNRRELTPCKAVRFVGLPADLQTTLLQKSRAEQIAGIKAWEAQFQQGGETEKK